MKKVANKLNNDEELQLKKLNIIFNIFLVFLIIQPFFDILSNFSNYNLSGLNIVTYLKPLFVALTYLYLFFFYKYKEKIRQFTFYLILFFFILAHSLLLYILFVSPSTILHEIRFIINIIYFITVFLTLKNFYSLYKDKEYFYQRLKYSLCITISLYIILYILAVLTDTSFLTYEFADSSKLGYRGWNYSGQILGHLLCISLPIYSYIIYNLKIHPLLRNIFLLIITIPFLLVGTKVPYFILLIVSVLYIIIMFIYKIIHHDYKINYASIVNSLIIVVASILIFDYLPVATNMRINVSVENTPSKEEDINKFIETMKETAQKNKENIFNQESSNGLISTLDHKIGLFMSIEERENLYLDYEDWTLNSLTKLNELYENGKLHSSDNRNRQLVFLHYKFLESSISFKALGLGYLNQPIGLSIERDIIMPLYCFGIVGFILFTGIFWLMLAKLIVIFLKNIKSINLDTIFLAEGFCMFFFISYEAGATYIYTQFGNILAIILVLLYVRLEELKKGEKISKQ